MLVLAQPSNMGLYFVAVLFACVLITVIGDFADFVQVYERFKPVCDILENNRVYANSSNPNGDPRKWSVNSETIRNFARGNKNLAFCNTTTDLVHSIRNHLEDYTCNVHWLSDTEKCQALSKYAHVYFFGDSHSRYVTQGLYALMTNDFRYGGYPRVNINLPIPFQCSCDGSFGTSEECRKYTMNFQYTDIRYDGAICTHVPSFQPYSFGFYDLNNKMPTADPPGLCDPDPRPRFVYLQGGSHFWTSFDRFNKVALAGSLAHILKVHADCKHKFKLVIAVTGM